MAVTQETPRKVSWARTRQTPRDRRAEDQLNRFAGVVTRSCAPLQKVLALATNSDPSWISRQCNGDGSGAVARFYQFLSRLAAHPKANPTPAIVGGLLCIGEAFDDLPEEELRRRLYEAMAAETAAQAQEDLASFRVSELLGVCSGPAASPGAWKQLCEALERQAEALIEEASRELEVVLLSWAYQRKKGWRA